MTRNHPLSRPFACLAAAVGSFLAPCCTSALGQNLYAPASTPTPKRPVQAPPAQGQPAAENAAPANGQPTGENAASAAVSPNETPSGGGGVEELSGVSLFAVTVPPPHKYAKHDPVEVIINESSVQNLTQQTDLKKDYTLKSELSNFPSLSDLVTHFALREGINGPHPALGLTGNKELKGTGQLNRKDQVTAKMTATVIDVKPNGSLVLEARKSIQTDKEITTMVLSGVCRNEDITRSNTVLSDQLADFNIKILHEGDVKDTGTKGIIPRILEAIFNF